MDTIDTFDSIDNTPQSSEAVSNVSPEQRERQKEKSSRALAGIRASQRDESRAKKKDNLFVALLSELLRRNENSKALDQILFLLKQEVPTHFLVVCFTLGFPWALDFTRESLHIAHISKFPEPQSGRGIFRDADLTEEEKIYIHIWIDTSFQILSEDFSEIITRRLLDQLSTNQRRDMEKGLQFFFEYFLTEVGFSVSPELTTPFTQYLLAQIEKKLRGLTFSDLLP